MKGWHGLGFPNVPAGLWVMEDGAIKHLIGGKGPVQADGLPLTGMDLISDDKFTVKAEDNKLATHRSGALYDMFPAPDTKKLNAAGQWNRLRIVLDGKHGEHWLNGEQVVEFDIGSPKYDAAFALSKYSKYPVWFAVRRAGQIVLQDHDGGVCFRDIRLREIN